MKYGSLVAKSDIMFTSQLINLIISKDFESEQPMMQTFGLTFCYLYYGHIACVFIQILLTHSGNVLNTNTKAHFDCPLGKKHSFPIQIVTEAMIRTQAFDSTKLHLNALIYQRGFTVMKGWCLITT